MIQAKPRPAADKVEALARMLIEVKRPVPVFGDEVWKSGAQAEAVQLCEMLGLPATTASPWFGYCNFPTHHPQFARGRAYPDGDPDLVIHFGTRGLGGMSIPDKPRFDPAVLFVAVGLDTDSLGRTQPMDLAIVADVRETLKDLIEAVKATVTADRLSRIREERVTSVTPPIAERQARLLEEVRRNFDQSPIHPDRVNYELEQAADDNAIVVMENYTARYCQVDGC
jgi:thiamine pyrophosphate-dependent acetolactate synthase large subunit-like protein